MLPLPSMAGSFKYPGRDDFGMKNMNIGIDMGSRVAIVGPNGAGKRLQGLCVHGCLCMAAWQCGCTALGCGARCWLEPIVMSSSSVAWGITGNTPPALAGKSTLMNLLAGDLTPTEGEQRRSHKLRVGRYAQASGAVGGRENRAVTGRGPGRVGHAARQAASAAFFGGYYF